MSTNLKTYKVVDKRRTSQSEPIPGEAQVQNNAGGFVYAISPWAQFQRFLVLGTTGGTYYVSEQKLTKDAAKAVEACIAEDGQKAVDLIVAISDGGRAPSNDPALFALALAAGAADPKTRQYALDALPKVARIPTHLFHFVEFTKGIRGWGRSLRRAIGDWVNGMDAETLAFEFAKYQSRDGWSTRDVLRKAHVVAKTPEHDAVLRWAVAGANEGLDDRIVVRPKGSPLAPRRYSRIPVALPSVILAMEQVKFADSVSPVLRAITDHGLTREMVPTQFLKDPAVWEALLVRMPPEAMIRNLGNMTKVGLLTAGSAATKTVVERLKNAELLIKKRIHPLKVVNALQFYKAGGRAGAAVQHRGSKTGQADVYQPVRAVIDALDEAFYLSFGAVQPTGKRLLLALDVSGSMSCNIPNTALTARDACAVLAMVTARVESDYVILGFTSGGKRTRSSGGGAWSGGNAISELAISPRQRLDDVVKYMHGLDFGGTDCALPALWAAEQTDQYDALSIYTDSETWAGDIHPTQALRDYRQKTGRAVKQVVVGMVATEFSIADPKDPLQIDVVGFDTGTPEVLSEFVRG